MKNENLEKKLKNVKTKLIKDLKKDYLEEENYDKIINKYLEDEQIKTDKISYFDLAVITTQIAKSKPIINKNGFKKDYITLENNKLPNEVKEDIEKYNELEKQTMNYVDETIKSNEFTADKFMDFVKSYIDTKTNDIDKFRKTTLSNRISINIILNSKYKFKEEKESKQFSFKEIYNSKKEEKLDNEFSFEQIYDAINKI
ncbi:MAG: hypothetical protein ACLFPJ_04075 [Candidatus Woesearchaeota archaeon]